MDVIGTLKEQENNDAHAYWSGRNCGADYLAAVQKDSYIAIVKTNEYNVYVYEIANVYALKCVYGKLADENAKYININKTFNTDISAQGIVNAVEEELAVLKSDKVTKFAKFRKAYGYTVDELAERSGVSPIAIYRLEKGKQDIAVTKYGTLKSIAQAIQREVAEIIDETK